MITDIQKRNQILRRISRIPKDKLGELDDFIIQLEQNISKESKTLSFAGSWFDIEESVFKEFTNNLASNREKNRRRINE